MPLRIWAQSATDLSTHGSWADDILGHGQRVLGKDAQVDLHGFRPGTYPPGLGTDEICFRYGVTHELVALQVLANAIDAERQGYDAFVVTSFMDHGVELARRAVDIPVLGVTQTSLMLGSAMASSMGFLSPSAAQAGHVRKRIRELGFENRVGALRSVDPEIPLSALEENGETLRKLLAENAYPLVNAGVDLIVPSEAILNSKAFLKGIREIDGVPVLDAIGALFAMAETFIRLKRLGSFSVSRSGALAKAPDDVLQHVRGVTAQALRDT